jgi:hypothetical protein
MPSHGRRCGALAIVLLLTIGHSAGMQTIAWIGMFADRIQTQSVGDAMTSIFDGAHPCALCTIARSLASIDAHGVLGDQTGKTPLKAPPASHDTWLIDDPCVLPTAGGSSRFRHRTAADALASSASSEPPTPPPRATCI